MSTNIFPAQSTEIRLAPDLTYPSSLFTTAPYEQVIIDPSTGGLVTALSLTGKQAVDLLTFEGLPTTENVVIKLTIDSIVIWNDTFTPTAATLSLFGDTNILDFTFSPFTCDTSFLLEVQTITDTAVTLNYHARPIL